MAIVGVAGLLAGAVSCGGTPSTKFIPNGGGVGVVIQGTPSADAARTDAANDLAADASADGAGGTDGQGAALGGSGGATDARIDAAAEVSDAGGEVAPMDDPCTACEKRRCSHPRALTSDKGDEISTALATYELCFLGDGWDTNVANVSVCESYDPGPTAMAGPGQGSPKSDLCRAFLDCIHQTNCAAVNDLDCYCGIGVPFTTCNQPGFKPMGPCIPEAEAAVESTDKDNIVTNLDNQCTASGAALFVRDGCDFNCCSVECLNAPTDPSADPSWCNADDAGAGGDGGASVSGVGGAGASGGAARRRRGRIGWRGRVRWRRGARRAPRVPVVLRAPAARAGRVARREPRAARAARREPVAARAARPAAARRRYRCSKIPTSTRALITGRRPTERASRAPPPTPPATRSPARSTSR